MENGKVKWYNDQRGYGFIQPDNGGDDIFVHCTAVNKAGLKTLAEGQAIAFERQIEKKKASAVNLKLID